VRPDRLALRTRGGAVGACVVPDCVQHEVGGLLLRRVAGVSAEAFFSLTDLCGLSFDDAIASLVRTARTVTAVALPEIEAPQASEETGTTPRSDNEKSCIPNGRC
jgi:hypothetical protein